ncbi:hypothetical protein M422DRAFT_59827 [Sphaerobolus stellatus SS14]|uniref:Delta 8-(E)-sphingolipid desaturase n=1 Tax=Sphaerobolus stellatus (strain SS14) TaxID=990650 RepID=A0A0C9US51_SPHS4|nr:hypothetical protein M422DRAFT_59827 [Sphaerobolus stellatus SS14]
MLPLWSPADIQSRILAGEYLLVRHGRVLRISQQWLNDHPGGALAILHFVGRDAADEINGYHSDETLQRMRHFIVARVDEPWKALLPPIMSGWVRRRDAEGKFEWHREAEAETEHDPPSQILLVKARQQCVQGPTADTITPPPSNLDPDTQLEHVRAYRALHDRIKQAGLYQTRYLTGYGPEILRYTLLATISAIAYQKAYFLTSALALGLLWHQVVFTVHDLGHCGVTHDYLKDRLIAIFLADLVGGVSVGWWCDNHNIHHLVTNHPSHDPDIQHLPFFAISPVFLRNLWSSYYKRILPFDAASALFITIQHKLFYIVMSLARFNLYRLSYEFLLLRAKRNWAFYTEVTCLVLFWSWYGTLLYSIGDRKTALAYLLISNVVPSPLHVQIVLSHFSRSTEDLGPQESFPHRQLRTTADVICPPSLAFIHGGLHLQVTHHLFPRLPRHNLLEASLLVKEYAKEQGLEYAEFGFIKGNSDVRGVLREVAKQVRIVKMVADANIEESIKGEVKH